MTARQEAEEHIRRKRMEKLMSIFDSRGRFKLSALLRIKKLHAEEETAGLLVREGLIKDQEQLYSAMRRKEMGEWSAGDSSCEPAPMSDDVLDRNVQYLKINSEALGNDDEE